MMPGGGHLDGGPGGSGACPGDGALVALLDGAVGEPPVRELRDHVDACPSCRARLARLRDRDDAVRSWLRRHDPTPPPAEAYDLPGVRSTPGPARTGHAAAARDRSRRRRWAAAAVLVLVAGVLAGPARGWVADRLDAVLPPASTPAADRGSDPSAATSFVPSGATLEVVFEGRPAGGMLTVDRGSDSLVTVRVPPGVELRVQSDRIVVAGSRLAEGVFGLSVPPGLDRVVVRVPGADPVDVDLRDEASMPLRVPLDPTTVPPAGG